MKCLGLPAVCSVMIASACFLFSVNSVMALEEAKYTVLEKADDFELRQYEPHIVAETFVEGDFENVGNEGFRRLFAYISGTNRKKESIPMTAPVGQEPSSENIAMTAPVGLERAGPQWRITFLMPPNYTMATLPEPVNPRVQLKEMPGRLMAALIYSGTWSKDRYEEKEAALRDMLKQKGLKPAGEPVFARYNSPFSLWFMRRNEVLIPVERGAP
jgi:hypothetical protein